MRDLIDLCEGISKLPPLPLPNQTPWWVGPLQELTSEVAAQSEGWRWTSGGCWAFADVLCQAYGGERMVVVVLDQRVDEWLGQHAVARVNGVLYDYEGVFVMPTDGGFDGHDEAMLVPHSEEDYHWMEEMHMDDDQLQRLANTFGL